MEDAEFELRQFGSQAHSSYLVASLPTTAACYTAQKARAKSKAGDWRLGRTYWIRVLNMNSDKHSCCQDYK